MLIWTLASSPISTTVIVIGIWILAIHARRKKNNMILENVSSLGLLFGSQFNMVIVCKYNIQTVLDKRSKVEKCYKEWKHKCTCLDHSDMLDSRDFNTTIRLKLLKYHLPN